MNAHTVSNDGVPVGNEKVEEAFRIMEDFEHEMAELQEKMEQKESETIKEAQDHALSRARVSIQGIFSRLFKRPNV
ncbi:MAG TPA: hypothetical protein VJB99_04885 [Patescibacteria group bacterium]|nr:hypothetical protein [Patescibacteria group bacterium]